MASKDQAIGAVICLVCVVVAIGYIIALFFPEFAMDILVSLGWKTLTDRMMFQLWLVAIPVLVAFVAILGIGAWIGWTMATTPPPKPIEEIEAEEEKAEEKKPEEEKPEEKLEAKPEEEKAAPAKKPRARAKKE